MGVVVGYVVVCYYIAYVTKTAGIKKKWIPVAAATAGLICGIVGHICGFTSGTWIDDIALGIFSGFSAVGTNEIAKYIFIRKE